MKYTAIIHATFTHPKTKGTVEESATITDNSRDIAVAAAAFRLTNMKDALYPGWVISNFNVSVGENG